MKNLFLVFLLAVGSLVSLAGGSWTSRPDGVEESRLANEDLVAELDLASNGLLSNFS
jgi:hypothetical protein